jgi:hypothetical protein
VDGRDKPGHDDETMPKQRNTPVVSNYRAGRLKGPVHDPLVSQFPVLGVVLGVTRITIPATYPPCTVTARATAQSRIDHPPSALTITAATPIISSNTIGHNKESTVNRWLKSAPAMKARIR